MSSSLEGVGVAVPLISGYSQQQNGELNSNSSNLSNLRKDSAHKLPSGLENPFIKNFGRKYNPPPLRTDAFDKRMSASWSSDKPQAEDEEVGEYKPGSGFVNKLRNKFLSQSSRDDPPFSSSPLKKSASVEDLLGSSERSKSKKSPIIASPANLDEKVEIGKPLSQTSKTSKWARSVECLSDGPRNNNTPSHQFNLASSLQIQHRTWEKEQSRSMPKSPRDIHNHIIAPDVGLGRDDIIIIEKTPDISELTTKKEDALSGNSDSPRDGGTPRPLSYREEFIVPEELPKHNTVVNIRSLFESVSHMTQGTTTSVKKNKPESLWHIGRSFDVPESPPAILSPASTVSNNNDTVKLESVLSPRPNDTYNNLGFPSSQAQTPVLSPRPPSPPSVSLLSFKSIEDKDTKDPSSSVSNSTTSSRLSSESSSEGGLTSPRLGVTGGTTFSVSSDDSKPPSNFKSSTSSRNGPRNTASVKPIVSSKKKPAPTKPAKPPVPLPSAPASAATSYKRSSPVVSVAPFKNQQEDKKEEGSPVMIFDNSKIKAKKRAERTKDYTPLDNDEISKTEVNSGGKKITVTNINIRGSSQGKGPSPSVPDTKKETQNNSFIFSNNNSESGTVTNINNNKLSSNSTGTDKKENKKPENVAFQNKDIILERKSYPAPSPSPRTKGTHGTHHTTQGNHGTHHTTPITEKSLTEKSRTQTAPPNNEVEKSRVQITTPKPEVKVGVRGSMGQGQGSMIYISSSSEASESDATPPVTPRNKVDAAHVPPSPRDVPPSPRVPPPASSTVFPTSSPSSVPTAVSTQPEPVKGIPSYIANRLARGSDSSSSESPKANASLPPSEAPVKGIPSFLANRLKQKEQTASQMVSLNKLATPLNSSSSARHSNIPDKDSSTDSDSFSPRNSLLHKTPAKSSNNDVKDISNTIQSEIEAVRQRMGNRSKATDVKQIFDSTQLKKKREENKRLKETFSSGGDSLVPRLDFSDLDKPKGQGSGPREVRPCSVTFIGAEVKTGRNLLKKQRKVKTNIRFNESPCEMFEYPTEDHALEMYLEEHPHDTEDIIFLEPFGGGESGESDDESPESPSTPRGEGTDATLRSSPALATTASGNLQSYKGRFSEEFVFGSSMADPEPPAKVAKPSDQEDTESMMLRPADQVDAWGANESSDLLF